MEPIRSAPGLCLPLRCSGTLPPYQAWHSQGPGCQEMGPGITSNGTQLRLTRFIKHTTSQHEVGNQYQGVTWIIDIRFYNLSPQFYLQKVLLRNIFLKKGSGYSSCTTPCSTPRKHFCMHCTMTHHHLCIISLYCAHMNAEPVFQSFVSPHNNNKKATLFSSIFNCHCSFWSLHHRHWKSYPFRYVCQ